MPTATVNQTRSLDQQYLDFKTRTLSVFEEYPQIAPLRYSIFKKLLVGRDHIRWADELKHWVRPILRRKRSREPSGKVDVLLFLEGSRDVIVNALFPVHREFAARGIKSALMSFQGQRDLPADAHEFYVPGAAIPPPWASSAWDSLCAVVQELQDPSLRKAFYYWCATTRALLDECHRVLGVLEPKIVLTASNPMEGGVAMGVASRAGGALALQLQHGMLQPFYTPVVADYLLTWGRSSSETLERLGVESHRLPALGSPRHDVMVQSKDCSARQKLLQTLSLRDRPTFAFFSNGNDLVRNGTAPFECARWLENIAARYLNKVNVIVRLHPNEDGSLFKDCPHLHVTKHVPDLAITLDGCDSIGSLCSTVLYDALLYGKPVWQFYADGWPVLADNWKHGLARRISSSEQLGDAIEMMLLGGASGAVDKNLCGEVFANHPRATQAIADFVENRL